MPKKQKTIKRIELPLLNEIRDFQHDLLAQQDSRYSWGIPLLPSYLTDNLKHKLRDYQESALRSLNYTQKDANSNSRFKQLLFHMATGSGKTDIMAALMLYMYAELGYQNFLFVVNTNSVLSKTKENLLNSASNKYLFKPNMKVEHQDLIIKEVMSFPKNPEKGMIYLRLATIQTLANELSSYRENGLTYEDLSQNKMVVLADEAHHFSADTKSGATATEVKNSQAWENTLARILQKHPQHRQFEFTATIDLQNENILNKYENKIVSQYELSRFVSDGYSKKVRYLQANADDESKMLNVILLSQYRKTVAHANGIEDFKPIILFKSNKIATSKQAHEKFVELIHSLTVESLKDFIEQSMASVNSSTLTKVYEHYLNRDLSELIVELQSDFSDLNIINVNDSDRSSEGILGDSSSQKALNTLEEADNPFRVIFAVAKLSEGWDVLNLYDIVRISEGAPTSGKTLKTGTNAEAQLIGRGARYYPFKYKGKKSFTRRFDNLESDLQFLEYLDYHTISEPVYLQSLKDALDKMGLPIEDDSDFDILSTKVKASFKKTGVYKSGKIYYNKLEEVPKEDWNSLAKYGIAISNSPEVDISTGVIETEEVGALVSAQTEAKILDMKADNNVLLKKAIARNPFYRFNQLKNYLPNLKSIDEFMNSENWLGQISNLQVIVSAGAAFNRELKLKAVEQYLQYVQRQIIMNYKRERGTNKFVGMPLRDMVQDYQKKVTRVMNDPRGQNIVAHPMKGEHQSWFPFEDAIVNDLEYRLIQIIQDYLEKLQEKYKDVYLIRNDERITQFKLHDFGDKVASYSGFMPDFLLYLGKSEEVVQVYIEPKGEHLLEKDGWKQDMLAKLNDTEILVEDDKIRLVGVRFFTGNNWEDFMNEVEERVLK